MSDPTNTDRIHTTLYIISLLCVIQIYSRGNPLFHYLETSKVSLGQVNGFFLSLTFSVFHNSIHGYLSSPETILTRTEITEQNNNTG